ncbi:hypothetical protein RYX36_004646 [Vicia faba]
MPVNRVGDFGLAPGISGRFTLFQTVDFSTIFARASAPRNSWISCNMRLNSITLICILLLIGAVGKSAQIGSHTWSLDAMESPTPVSALIHAATMVTAGVFVIARCSPLFEYPPTALIVITSAGATTSFLAATTGILQNDLKRVIAYSTCSQLGYMIFACGISNYSDTWPKCDPLAHNFEALSVAFTSSAYARSTRRLKNDASRVIFFIRLPSRSRSGSGTGTSSLFDMVSFHQSDSTGSKGFTSEPFLARGH